MSVKRRRRRTRAPGRVLATVVFATTALLGSGNAALAQSAEEILAQQIAQAILAGDMSDPSLDLNGDGTIDIADIVCVFDACHKGARFTALEQSAGEGDGTVFATVTLGDPFTGTLNYSFAPESTAVPGSDVASPAGTIAVAGSSVDIPITILDDADEREEIEFVVVQIEPGTGYSIGALNRHVVHITDNDARWLGSMTHGEGRLHFAIDVVNQGGSTTARVASDGVGTFPLGDFNSTWMVGPTDFSAVVVPIAMPATAISLGVDCERQISFAADASANIDDRVEPELIVGSYTEVVIFSGYPHLDRTNAGTFMLLKEIAEPSSYTPALVTLP